MKKKILTIIITILILVYFSINVFSENEIANNEVISNVLENVENSMTLEEQKQEVENKLAESSNRLEYVQGELTTSEEIANHLWYDTTIKDCLLSNTLKNEVIPYCIKNKLIK